MLQKFMKFMRDEEGASAVEYGLIVGLIAIAIVVILSTVGTNLSTIFTTISNCLSAAGCS